MLNREMIEEQLRHTLQEIDIVQLGSKVSGKVRDSYVLGSKRILIATDRLSAFDRIITTIPFKGQLLTQMAAHWFGQTKHIVDNHIIGYPHPNVMVAEEVEIVPVEVVVRGYIAGSAWRDYEVGRAVSGVKLPGGLRKSEQFSTPLITPSTKAEHGEHDEPISSEEIINRGIVEESLWKEICEKALALFEFGSKKAEERGLILADTKYEFGTKKDAQGGVKLLLADEVHTQDSSRFWLRESYLERFEKGEDPHMLDKEFVRRHLIKRGYMGEGEIPVLDDAFRVDTAIRYMEAFEQITGSKFTANVGSLEGEIYEALKELIS